MTTRIWTKPQTQQTLKALRAHGYKVAKLDAGYVAHDLQGLEVFKAMQGMNGYLVKFENELFVNSGLN